MKVFLPLLCSLLLIGCSDSTSKQAPETSNETQSVTAAPANANSTNTVQEEANKTAAEPAAAITKVADNNVVDGAALFAQKCASCHGAKADKSALNKSQIIATLTEVQIKDALKGYQNGTYGREMKAVMQGQAKPLNDAQIDALAKYVSGL